MLGSVSGRAAVAEVEEEEEILQPHPITTPPILKIRFPRGCIRFNHHHHHHHRRREHPIIILCRRWWITTGKGYSSWRQFLPVGVITNIMNKNRKQIVY